MSRQTRNSSLSFATFFESFPKKSLFDLVISAERCTFAAAFRGVAQLVALLVWDQAVARSSRVAPTEIQNLKEKSLITNFTIGSQRLLLLLFSIA